MIRPSKFGTWQVESAYIRYVEVSAGYRASPSVQSGGASLVAAGTHPSVYGAVTAASSMPSQPSLETRNTHYSGTLPEVVS